MQWKSIASTRSTVRIMPTFLENDGFRIAYRHHVFAPGSNVAGEIAQPTLVFLPGYGSDMTGTKAEHILEWAQAQGVDFLRLDYRGHGESTGVFVEHTVSEWLADAIAVIDHVLEGKPMVLIGSSMGGWLAAHVCRQRTAQVKGMLLLAPAPDFPLDHLAPDFTAEQRAQLEQTGVTYFGSDNPEEQGLPISKVLLDDAANLLLLDKPAWPWHGMLRVIHGVDDDLLP